MNGLTQAEKDQYALFGGNIVTFSPPSWWTNLTVF